jgi:EmrB/QacA subfamily drug resistance transporter
MSDPIGGEPAKFLILLCVSVPSFMLNLDANIVAVSLPAIAHSLKADFAAIEWVVSAYTLTFASLVLPAGMLADRYGRKNVLLLGLGIFTLASFICGAAPTVGMLNGARALQGVGAALLLSAALATLSDEFRGTERVRAFAFWGSVIGVAITLGPVTGGFITHMFGWEWAFYINVPVGLALMGLTLYAVRSSRDPKATGIDVPGSLSFAGALFLVMLALISGNHQGWKSSTIAAELVGASVLFGAFVVIELKQLRPMLELRYFRRPTYIGANIAGLAYAAALLTMVTFLPLYLQGGLGMAPQKAGLLMLPLAMPPFLVPRLVARYLTHRLSGRVLLAIGLGLIGVGLLWLAVVAARFQYASMFSGMLIAGIGAGILNGETAKVGMTAIPPERAGMAAGVGGTVRFAGLVVGFAVLGAILFAQVDATLLALLPVDFSDARRFAIVERIVAGDLPGADQISEGLKETARVSFGAGYRAVFLSAAALAAVAAIASWVTVRSSDTAPVPKDVSSKVWVASARNRGSSQRSRSVSCSC